MASDGIITTQRTDGEKLRALADWFDMFDTLCAKVGEDEVQLDLRRMAGRLDELDIDEEKQGKRCDCVLYGANGRGEGMRVYIAGPYTGGDPVLNTRAAILAAEDVIALGHTPFVPHLSHLWHLISPHEVDYWLKLDLAWLEACDCLIRLPGASVGADGEVRRAHELRLPVYTFEEWAEHVCEAAP